jgi:hypothetical protein
MADHRPQGARKWAPGPEKSFRTTHRHGKVSPAVGDGQHHRQDHHHDHARVALVRFDVTKAMNGGKQRGDDGTAKSLPA